MTKETNQETERTEDTEFRFGCGSCEEMFEKMKEAFGSGCSGMGPSNCCGSDEEADD